MDKYRDWDILDELPHGWSIDKYAGSPVAGTVFVTNGKSVLNGQQRALLKVDAKQNPLPPQKEIVKPHFFELPKTVEESVMPIFPAKKANDLARLKFKEQILKEVLFDLMVCEIEGWDKKQYIDELRQLLNEIGASNN